MAKKRAGKGTTKKTRPKFHVKRGDRVEVITGEWKGAQGVIRAVLAESERVIVEGVNMRRRIQRKTPTNPEGGIIEREVPIHISNVRLIERG